MEDNKNSIMDKKIEWTVGSIVAIAIGVFSVFIFFMNTQFGGDPFMSLIGIFLMILAVVLGYLSSINARLKQIRDNTAEK